MAALSGPSAYAYANAYAYAYAYALYGVPYTIKTI